MDVSAKGKKEEEGGRRWPRAHAPTDAALPLPARFHFHFHSRAPAKDPGASQPDGVLPRQPQWPSRRRSRARGFSANAAFAWCFIQLLCVGCGTAEKAEDTFGGDATTEAAADVSAPDTWPELEIVTWEGLDAGACGIQDDGSYLGPCDLELGPGWHSSLCDEAEKRCVPPKIDCHAGWCTIPSRSYVSGAAPDSDVLGARPSAISYAPRAFLIQQSEVSVAQFRQAMGYASPYRATNCGESCAAGGVTVFEAMEFANRLSATEGLEPCYTLDGCGERTIANPVGDEFVVWACERSTFSGPTCRGFRLPSRAEWELAARAGSPFCFPRGPIADIESSCAPASDAASSYSTYCGNSNADYKPCRFTVDLDNDGVAECAGPVSVWAGLPNDFGLFGAYGNVSEYVQQLFDPRLIQPEVPVKTGPPYELLDEELATTITDDDEVAAMGGAFFQVRAQTCAYDEEPNEAAYWNIPAGQNSGFRLVRTLDVPR